MASDLYFSKIGWTSKNGFTVLKVLMNAEAPSFEVSFRLFSFESSSWSCVNDYLKGSTF